MTKKEKISKFLQEWNGDGYTVQDVYIEKECADLMAEGIVKLFSIPDVVHQREQFKSMVFDMANKLAIEGNGDEAVMMHKIHNRL